MRREQTRIDELKALNNFKTDGDLAKAMGITQQKLSYYIRKDITMKVIEKLMKVFNVTYREMFKEDAKLED